MAGDTRTYISPKLKESIVRDYHGAHLSVSDLKRKYRVAYNTVDKIIKTTPYGFWNAVAPDSEIRPPVTETRKYLPTSAGASSPTELCKRILHLVFQRMIEMLEDPDSNLSPNQLCSIVLAVSPHIFKNKGNEEEDSRKAIMEMFKARLNGKN